MSQSILTSTKKVLGVEESDTSFDVDILMHINSVFATLNQLGLGPDAGYMIEDATPTWDAFLGGDKRVNSIKSYVYLKVRMMFDPPQIGHLVAAMNEQIKEFEWRLNVRREEYAWVDPDPGGIPEDSDDLVLDGGGA